MCIKKADGMKCVKCGSQKIVRNGKSKSGKQRCHCKFCGQHFQSDYTNKAYAFTTNDQIIALSKEGVGTRSIARILSISPTTVTRRILEIASKIKKPSILMGREYEVDEMMTFIGNKDSRICIVYALDRKTREVVCFSVGRRNLRTLRMVVNTLLLSNAREIRTDKCPLYSTLIPKEIHHVKRRGINYIERKNLTLRTHI